MKDLNNMNYKNLFIISLFSLFLVTSCKQNSIFEQNIKIPNRVWTWDNPLTFSVDITDTINTNRIYANIRNDGKYALSNIYLFVTITSPGGAVRKDTINLELADHTGRWYGKGIGDIWDHQIVIYDNIKFSVSGTYNFVFEQGTRIEKLENILDVGIKIEKINIQ